MGSKGKVSSHGTFSKTLPLLWNLNGQDRFTSRALCSFLELQSTDFAYKMSSSNEFAEVRRKHFLSFLFSIDKITIFFVVGMTSRGLLESPAEDWSASDSCRHSQHWHMIYINVLFLSKRCSSGSKCWSWEIPEPRWILLAWKKSIWQHYRLLTMHIANTHLWQGQSTASLTLPCITHKAKIVLLWGQYGFRVFLDSNTLLPKEKKIGTLRKASQISTKVTPDWTATYQDSCQDLGHQWVSQQPAYPRLHLILVARKVYNPLLMDIVA